MLVCSQPRGRTARVDIVAIHAMARDSISCEVARMYTQLSGLSNPLSIDSAIQKEPLDDTMRRRLVEIDLLPS